jgi:hypothetical protein
MGIFQCLHAQIRYADAAIFEHASETMVLNVSEGRASSCGFGPEVQRTIEVTQYRLSITPCLVAKIQSE